MSVEITTRGLEQLIRYFERFPSVAEESAVLAVNDGIRFAHTLGARKIRDQVNFTARYLGSATDGGNDRFKIVRRASAGAPEAVLRARERPTSLARFVQGSKKPGKRTNGRSLRVKVSTRGGTVTMPGAWLMRLRAGKALDDETFNLGLAIRLKPGQYINKKRLPAGIAEARFGERYERVRDGKLYMLYGPSVAQVFDDVALDIQEPVSDRVENEFIRQFERLRNR